MASRTFTINSDTMVRSNNPTSNYGTGIYAFVGKENYYGTTNRALFKFNLDWTSVASVTSAVLWVRSDDIWVGASPTFDINRVTSTWTEYGATWNNQPSITATNAVLSATTDGGTAGFNKWYSYNITGIVNDWFTGSTNYGIKLTSTNEGSISYSTEFSTRESAYDPYITLTYVDNVAPNAPTLNSPVGGALVASQTPTLNFTPSDPDGDTHTKYTYQVDNNSDFSSPVESTEVTGSFANGVAVNRAVVATLSRGTTYYWRVKTFDGSLYGAYSAGGSFKIMVEPTVTAITTPSANGHVIESSFTAGDGVDAPKPLIRWTFNCADAGHTQNGAEIKVYSDAGSLLATESVTGTTLFKTLAYGSFVRNTLYRFSVKPTCSGGVQASSEYPASGASARQGRFTYGQGSFKYNTTTPTSWTTPVVDKSTSGGYCELEYASSAGGAEPSASAWKSSVSSVPLNAWLHYRVTMSNWGSATPTSPALRSVVLKWNSNAIAPDSWEPLGTGESIDSGSQFYGTQALRLEGDGATRTVDQTVHIPQGNESVIHMLSVRIMTEAGGGGQSSDAEVQVLDASKVGTLVGGTMTPVAGTTGWKTYVVGPLTPDASDVVVRCQTTHAAGATSTAWFDALKLESSAVVTPWTAGTMANGVALDSGGVQVDASNNSGAVFRLKGSAGGARDTVELGANALVFGGDTEVYSDSAGTVRALAPSGADTYISAIARSGRRGGLAANVEGDSASRFFAYGDATLTGIELGPGSGARDTNLYRSAANVLKTDDTFDIGTGGRLRLTGIISPTALAANANDWAPTGYATANVIRISSDATMRTITGFTAGGSGDLVYITNTNNGTPIRFTNDDAASAAANRFYTPSLIDFLLLPRATAVLFYDITSTKWRILSGDTVPSGAIMLWSGETTTIPGGYVLCDGTNGTPDLRDRFIIGASTTNENTSGGTISASTAITAHGTHGTHTSHGFTQPSTHGAHTMGSIGVPTGNSNRTVGGSINSATDTHTHAAPTITAHGAHSGGAVTTAHSTHSTHSAHEIQNYYRLAYIMKV